jgi:hypothetical protein
MATAGVPARSVVVLADGAPAKVGRIDELLLRRPNQPVKHAGAALRHAGKIDGNRPQECVPALAGERLGGRQHCCHLIIGKADRRHSLASCQHIAKLRGRLMADAGADAGRAEGVIPKWPATVII